ncbi:hypothetical protein D6D22_08589 [Aureobasidium pullulans]|uniref:NACHT domain-containing protein n=2 Tax=Aureobasidium pullulans TaxID=5580 RepID=A0A4S8X5F0_AURPU|nr:hypothetical protein D6D22_08589 [Aureobasidium pullulans]
MALPARDDGKSATEASSRQAVGSRQPTSANSSLIRASDSDSYVSVIGETPSNPMSDEAKLTYSDYTVAWICPLEIEQIAALKMLDKIHPRLPQWVNDHNAYTFGSVQGHNIIVAGLPTTGNCSAATVVAQIRKTFPHLKFGLLVGIGGGVPTKTYAGPIRLGHIVVSEPVGQHSGAVQYDHGKAEAGTFMRTGFLAPAPNVLLNAARESEVRRRRLSEDPLVAHLRRIDTSKRGLRNFKRPSFDQDHLYEPSYAHVDGEKSCKKCGCETGKRVDRSTDDSDDENVYEEDDGWLTVHRGTIASGELVMRDGRQRDTLAQNDKILCFEMEAAGALNNFPCLVVRGISDYSDSHKNDKWHGYAAAVAAAYARELFFYMPVDEVKQCRISETDVLEMVQNTKEFARAADYTEVSRAWNWLRPADASVDYRNASDLRHPNTGLWFLESDSYRRLKTTPATHLWLRGIPGSGKSVIASTIIEDLQKDKDVVSGSAVVYFFFSFSDASKQTLEHMLRSLIYQLAVEHKSPQLMSLVESRAQGSKRPQVEELITLFKEMVGELRDVVIILDALDEAREQLHLLEWITSASHEHCRFFLTSRWDSEIEEALDSWLSPNCTTTLEEERVDDDIKAYIHHRLRVESSLSRWKSMYNLISYTLVERSGGLFRRVSCQLDELSTCMDEPAVLQTLATLPSELNETYDRILRNIPRARVPNAIKILQLLAFAKRPLLFKEIIDALATDPDSEPPFDPENRIVPPDAIAGYCSSLLRITAGNGGGPEMQLAHFSVQEYLLLDRLGNPYNGFFREVAASAAITQILLAYLWTAAAVAQETVDSTTKLSDFPLARFAAQNWLDFARRSGEDQDDTFAWTSRIFMQDSFMRYWLSFYDPGVDGMGNDAKAPALYYAALGGLHRSVRSLLDGGANPNAQGGRYGNALQATSLHGNVQTAKILVEYGADINAQAGLTITH